MIEKVISGGQTGADRGGLLAAKALGIATGGWAPYGYRTEVGSDLTLVEFGLKEHTSKQYPPRTLLNIQEADCTLLFARNLEAGSKLTQKLCFQQGKPSLWLTPHGIHASKGIAIHWLLERKHSVVNVAGNRESKSPGIQLWTEAFLREVFLVVQEFGKLEKAVEEH